MAQELASGGELRQAQTYDFTFKNVEKQYESYSGINVKLRCVSSALKLLSCGLSPPCSPDPPHTSFRAGSFGSSTDFARV